MKFGTQDISNTYIGYLWPCNVQDHWGSFGAIVSKWPVSRKRLVVEQNEVKFGIYNIYIGYLWPYSEIWDSVVPFIHILGTFDLIGLKVILGSFGARFLFFSKWPVIKKGWPWSETDWNLGSGTLVTHISGTFDLVGFKVIWCTCLKMACRSKTVGCGAKWSEIWQSRTPLTFIWGTYDLVVLKVILGSFSAFV